MLRFTNRFSSQKELATYLCQEHGIKDSRICEALSTISRASFLPDDIKARAFEDLPLPIQPFGFPTSAPHIYAMALKHLNLQPGNKVLDIGCGCGYFTALLAYLVRPNGRVEGWDISEEIVRFADKNLAQFPTLKSVISLKVQNAFNAPSIPKYDRVYVGAGATERHKKQLLSLLKDDGIMIIPCDGEFLKIRKQGQLYEQSFLSHVSFAPLVEGLPDQDMSLIQNLSLDEGSDSNAKSSPPQSPEPKRNDNKNPPMPVPIPPQANQTPLSLKPFNDKYHYVLEGNKKKRLGAGGFGQVFLMQNVTTKQLIAMKLIAVKTLAEAQAVLNEGILGLKLSHKNILAYSDIFLHESEDISGEWLVCFATEYCEKGDLRRAINYSAISNKELLRFLKDICDGLLYLHKQNIVHRDLKPDNVLVAQDGTAKIADMGLGKFKLQTYLTTYCGTPLYTAPEVSTQKYTEKADIWSLGCIFLELLSRDNALSNFCGSDPVSLQQNIKQPSFSSRLKTSLEKYNIGNWSSRIVQMVSLDPKDRPDISTICSWF
jgi:protein-L-isoaspartate(D-aspartate) O-methyltransferase